MPMRIVAVSNRFSGFCEISKIDVALGKHSLIAFDRTRLVFSNLIIISLSTLSPKITTSRFFHVETSFYKYWPEVGLFTEVEIVFTAFLDEYVVAVVVAQSLVEVDIAADADDLLTDTVAGIFVVAALADIVFDDDYIAAGVNFDVVVVADLVVAFVVFALDDGGVPAVAHVEA